MPKWVYPAASVVALLLMWHVVVVAFSIAPYLVPRPLPVFEYIAANASFLLFHAGVTTYETIGGFLLSLIVGIPLAMLLVWSRPLEQAVMPLLVLSQTFPKVALAPLFIIWFGFGVQTKVLISFLIAFFPVVVSTIVGMRSVENDMIDLARSLNSSARRTFLYIRLPHALPSILSGMKVAIAFAVVGAVVGEWVGADSGLGYLLLRANANLDTVLLFAILVMLMIIGTVLYYLVVLVERMLIPWHVSMRGDLMALST